MKQVRVPGQRPNLTSPVHVGESLRDSQPVAERLAYVFVLSMACLLTPALGMTAEPNHPQAGAAPSVSNLHSAVEDWMAMFPDRRAQGRQHLVRLKDAQPQDAEWESLQRQALAANPLVSGQPLLFVVRRQYARDHHNTATMFQTGEINTRSFQGGGALKTIDLATGQVNTLLDVPDGVARDPDVSFDGTKILFSMRRNREDDYHLYEMNTDGSALRQITFGSGVTDIDPIYLPDGRILFTSTREPKYCMCNRHIMGNLFTVEADGSNVQQIGHSTLHEGHASLLPDGRIIYDRWEYVDRNFGDAQGVWSCSPDGTNHAVYWGNNTNSPGAVLDNRAIPGTDLLLANFSSCHDRPWGALAIVDRRLGLDGREPVLRTWPADAIELVGKGNYDTFTRVNPKYEDPYPLSDKVFLCSRMTGRGEEMGIYLPLMLIPLLALVTTFLQTKVTEWTSPAQKRLKEQKALAKKNPARQAPENDPSAAMTSSMKYFMPLMIVFFTFSMPAAMGLYWVVGNILGIAQSYAIYWILYGFPKKKTKPQIVPVNQTTGS